MTPDLPTRVREAFAAPEVVEAVARAIYGVVYSDRDPDEFYDSPLRLRMEDEARAALAAIPLAAVIAVVQEDRTREIVSHLRGAASMLSFDNQKKWMNVAANQVEVKFGDPLEVASPGESMAEVLNRRYMGPGDDPRGC